MNYDKHFLESVAGQSLAQATGVEPYQQTWNCKPTALVGKPYELLWSEPSANRDGVIPSVARTNGVADRGIDPADSRTYFNVEGREEDLRAELSRSWANLTSATYDAHYVLGAIPIPMTPLIGTGDSLPYPNHLPTEVNFEVNNLRTVYIGKIKLFGSNNKDRNTNGIATSSYPERTSIDDALRLYSGRHVTWVDPDEHNAEDIVVFTGALMPPTQSRDAGVSRTRAHVNGFQFTGYRMTIKE